jgi:membrane fusion protein (multidrug efflux system)
LRSLAADGSRRSAFGILAVAALLSTWGGWFALGRVVVHATSESGRVEVEREVHPVQSPIAGRVVATRLGLGKEVSAGAPLVELDSEAERLRLDEERRQAVAAAAQMDQIRREIAHEEEALARDREAARSSAAEGHALVREAEQEAELAEDEARRAEALRAREAIAEVEMLRSANAAGKRRAVADARAAHAASLDADRSRRESAARAHLDALRREEARLAGAVEMSHLAASALESLLEKRTIRAPVDGSLAEVAALRPGAFVREGDRLGSVLPHGELRIVAEFLPAAALGRIRPGMPARFRLDGFPWAHFGNIGAVVTGVAAEVRDGRVRVEAALRGDGAPQVPRQHGLPGTLEVEVERISPALLVMRGTSRLLDDPGPAGAPLAASAR